MIATSVRALGAIVRQKRKALDWSQDKLAAAAGVSRPWLSEFEAGKASVEIGLVFAVLDALGMHVNVTSSSALHAGAAGRAAAASAPVRATKKGSMSGRPAITIGGKSISSTRARGSSPTRMARPAPSSGKKK